jgi:hypothetical protein
LHDFEIIQNRRIQKNPFAYFKEKEFYWGSVKNGRIKLRKCEPFLRPVGPSFEGIYFEDKNSRLVIQGRAKISLFDRFLFFSFLVCCLIGVGNSKNSDQTFILIGVAIVASIFFIITIFLAKKSTTEFESFLLQKAEKITG